MNRMVIRHLSGSKANQVEEYPLGEASEFSIGRDPSSTIRFDPERDDLVGRQHAKIIQDFADPGSFSITDLNSRNGTYVNNERVVGSVALSPGDVVQLGSGGPEFEFDIDPPPVRATRMVRSQSSLAVSGVLDRSPSPTGQLPRPAWSETVGKATVERMVREARRDVRKTLFIAIATVVLILAAVAGALQYRSKRIAESLASAQKNRPWTAAEIAARYTEATVFVEVGWKLIFTETGEQLYHEYYQPTDKHGQPLKDEQGKAVSPVPIYTQLPDGKTEPSLTMNRGERGQNQPIGERIAGSGFVVTNDGFILTNRHVAAPWESRYDFPQGPGLLVKLGSKEGKYIERPPADWVPASAKVVGGTMTGKDIDGRIDYLDVTFAHSKLRIPAKLARVSDRHDVAMIKIDIPQPVTKVELFDNYDSIKPGDSVTVMGYPEASPVIAVASRSEDYFSRQPVVRNVPDPTISPGNVGRILRGEIRASAGQLEEYYSEFGDAYQLNTTTAGPGNSGGPMFDDHGRVIGIFFASREDRGMLLTFAVPIRYGIELMGIRAPFK